jgi:hypothetical protein
MDFEKILADFNLNGFESLNELSLQELDELQDHIKTIQQEYVDKFPELVHNACDAVKNILEITNPINKLKNEICEN